MARKRQRVIGVVSLNRRRDVMQKIGLDPAILAIDRSDVAGEPIMNGRRWVLVFNVGHVSSCPVDLLIAVHRALLRPSKIRKAHPLFSALPIPP